MHYEISCLMEIFFSRILVVYWMFRKSLILCLLNGNDINYNLKKPMGVFL